MSQPYEIFGSQNTNDDDGPVIDSFFIETDSPPDMTEAREPIDPSPKDNPPIYGRLLTGTVSMTVAVFTTPFMVLPADANRKSITLSVFSSAAQPEAAVEYLIVSDENGKVLGTGGFNLRHGKDPVTLNDYTGPVFVMPAASLTAAMELSWVAVTK